jgi:glycosyltransferase involved in cell wall biosynthesis
MRVAILADESLPSGTRAHSKMLHDLAVEIQRRGHKPVIISPGKPDQSERLVVDYVENIENWRFRSGYTRGKGLFVRAVNEWLLSYRAWLAIKSALAEEDFNLCINYSPTIFFGPLAKRLKNRGAYVFLVLRDLFPQWAIDKGIIAQGSILARFFKYYEKKNYALSDCIGLQSPKNLEIFKDKNPSYGNAIVLFNWTSDVNKFEARDKTNIRGHYNLENKTIFFYGGNIGRAQDMTNIMTLAKNMRSYKSAFFLIVGEGDEFQLINQLKRDWGLDNVLILDSVSQAEYRKFLHVVDVGLLSLSGCHSAHNFPGKLLSYMESSIPILGSINRGNDLIPMVNGAGAGYIHINGEDDLLLKSAIELADNVQLRKEQGDKSRRLMQDKFTVGAAADAVFAQFHDTELA